MFYVGCLDIKGKNIQKPFTIMVVFQQVKFLNMKNVQDATKKQNGWKHEWDNLFR